MRTRASIVVTALVVAGLSPIGCGQRTVTTTTEGARIPARVLDRLDADMSSRDWLVLLYGEPDRVESRADGGEQLVWVFTRHTTEHRPDPHEEVYVEEATITVDGAGRIVETTTRQENRRLD